MEVESVRIVGMTLYFMTVDHQCTLSELRPRMNATNIFQLLNVECLIVIVGAR